MNLWEYIGEKVEVTFTDGTTMRGNAEFYTSSLDNEPDPESIMLRSNATGILTELFKPEIVKIEVIEW